MPPRWGIWIALAGLSAALLAGPAAAQLGGLVGGLARTPGAIVGGVGEAGALVGEAAASLGQTLAQARQLRVTGLVAANPADIDLDPAGMPVVRDEVLVIMPSADVIASARALGFQLAGEDRLEALDIRIVTFKIPPGLDVREAARRLKRANPKAEIEFNHLYAGAGEAAAIAVPVKPAVSDSAPGVRIGLVDTGVDPRHPAFAASRIEQKGFAPGGARPGAHGTAVASLLVGKQGALRGAAPGASLYVADVYGATPRGGSAASVAAAMNWMGQTRPSVVNVSLVGPPNRLLQAAVEGLLRRDVLVVAAVSNDGPASPLAYPASYRGVISVVGVDRRGRRLLETGRASHVDFAAPGADVIAAVPGGGVSAVRGASFAAPLVAGRLARLSPRSVAALGREAQDLGARGPDKIFGHGLIGAEVFAASAR